MSTAEREEIKTPRGESAELRRSNEILPSASLSFARELDSDRSK
jgi:transposase-like protein